MSGFRRWRRAPDFPERTDRFNDSGDGFLEGVDSTLVGFGETGQRGFSEAWQDSTGAFDDAASAFANDERDVRGRDLDARSGRWKALLVFVACLGIAGWFAYSEGIFDRQTADGADDSDDVALIAPDLARVYESEPTAIIRSVSGQATTLFRRAEPDGNPAPASAEEPLLVRPFTAGPVLWAGRMHIALSGPGLDLDGLCVVATLVSDDLATIDLAATGDCDGGFDATGDRVACIGNQTVMLEVWPFDPRAATRPPAVSAIRFRVEAARADGAVWSQRGTVALPALPNVDSLLSSATILGGAPGDVVTIDGQQCTLVDRSDISIQLLPS